MSETCIRKTELAPSLHMPGFSEECLPCVLLCYHMLHSRVALSHQFGQNSAQMTLPASSCSGRNRITILLLSHLLLLRIFLLRTVRDMGSLPVSFSARQRHTKVSKTIESRASQLHAQGNGVGGPGVLSLCCCRTESWSRYLTGCTNCQVSSLLTH